MNANDHTDREVGSGPERYATVTINDGEVVIYDRDDHRRWIQSDAAVVLGDMR